jgi:hypothetical protein
MLTIEAETLVETGGVRYRTITGGDYEEQGLVEVYREGDEQKNSIGAFQAHYIVHGYHVGELPPN